MERILHVVGIMNTGGIETWLMNIFKNIDRTKIQFDFVVHAETEGYYDDAIGMLGGKIIRVPKFKLFNYNKYKAIWENILQEKKYKILHTHIRSTASIYLKIAKKNGMTTISHAHNTSNGKFPMSFVKMFLQHNISKYSDVRLACSNIAGCWLFKKNPFKIIKNGIEVSLYEMNDEVRTAYRIKYNLSDENIVIGHIGRFTYQKNHNFLLEIFLELYKRNNMFRLVLVGDGELKNNIEKKIQYFNIKDNVIYMGVRSDIPQLLQMFDAFLFPSHYEGLPVTVIEAQAAGLNCFISDNISDEVVITNLIHFISLKKNAKYWANYIIGKLEKKREYCFQVINDTGFDIKEVAKELEEIYYSYA